MKYPPPIKNRKELADLIVEKLIKEKSQLQAAFQSKGRINSCYIDDLLPISIAQAIYDAFPTETEMSTNKSIREYKKIAAQMNQYNPLLEEIVFAFQDDRIVKICEEITGIESMQPDSLLYAGGISLMAKDNFLNPHLDNSHDNNRQLYRVLNLLYYVTPDWQLSNGGNLELWDNGVKGSPRTIVSKFNRLALMITNTSSYHAVSKVRVDKERCCVSNYYFSAKPAEDKAYFHVTSFYGRPEEPFKSMLLKLDRNLRNFIRKITGKRIIPTKHIYKKED